jgi:hypothetical protein
MTSYVSYSEEAQGIDCFYPSLLYSACCSSYLMHPLCTIILLGDGDYDSGVSMPFRLCLRPVTSRFRQKLFFDSQPDWARLKEVIREICHYGPSTPVCAVYLDSDGQPSAIRSQPALTEFYSLFSEATLPTLVVGSSAEVEASYGKYKCSRLPVV